MLPSDTLNPASHPPLLSCQDLTFQRPGFSLEVSFTLKKGDRLAVTGPSGRGKTTLLLILAGFLPAQGGKLCFTDPDSQRPQGASPDTLQQPPYPLLDHPPEGRPFAFLFQENNLFDHLTVIENMALAFHRRTPTPAQRQEIQRLLSDFGLEGLEQRLPPQLSGGQKRRIGLARCLLLRRPILLLDEPFNGIDTPTVERLIDLLKTQDQTLIFTSHHKSQTQALATQILGL